MTVNKPSGDKQPVSPDKNKSPDQNKRDSRIGAAGDGVVFIGALIVSALALAAVAVATPIIVAVSLIAGLMFKNAPTKSWRRAGV